MVAARQVALAAPSGQIPEAARVEQVRAYARVALADGAITEHEFAYLRKAGGELGLKTAVIDRVIDDETRRSGVSYTQPRASSPAPPAPSTPVVTTANGSGGPSAWTRVRSSVTHPVQAAQVVRDRRLRSAIKASTPVVLGCCVAAALAPVVAPVGLAVLGLPLLAAIGEVHRARGWRAYAKAPWRVAVYGHHVLGPIAAAGAASTFVAGVPGLRPDVTARVLAAVAAAAVCWLAIVRLPSGSDAFAAPLRAGRDLIRSALVGPSGRTRRSAYVVWAVVLGAAAVLVTDVLTGASHTLWWPLHGLR
jgi:hypothetical protein